MINNNYLRDIDFSQISTKEQLHSIMVLMGYDFNLCGTRYIYELFASSLKTITQNTGCQSPNMSILASKYNVKPKSLNRDMRWAYQRKERYNKVMKQLAHQNNYLLDEKEM